MSALAEALVAAQRRSLATLEKAYVAGQIDKVELSRQMSMIGLTDTVDGSFLLASLDVLKEWGATLPAEPNGKPETEKASEKQLALIRDLCKRKNVPAPDLLGLTKAQASEVIASIDNGSYDPEKWSLPF